MKFFIAIMLSALSMLAHAEDRLEEMLNAKVASLRVELLNEAGPYQRVAVVEELVQAMSMHDVDVRVSQKPIPGGAIYYPGVILIGADLADLPRAQMAFILAHEYGHHVRRHWKATLSRGVGLALAAGVTVKAAEDLDPFVDAAVTPETKHRDEYEADASAVVLLKHAKLYDVAAIEKLMQRIGADESVTHPSGADRVKAMKAHQ